MIVNLGPQFVQVMKKYSNLGSFGSLSSFKQSLHIAMSGGMTEPECSVSLLLF